MHGRRLGRRACSAIIQQPGAEMQARRRCREQKRCGKAKCRRKRAGRPESRRKAAITRQAREREELSKKQSTRFKAVSSPGSPKLAVAVALATDFLPELELPASSRRVRRRTERKVRANTAQAQAEAQKAGGRRAKRFKSKARRQKLSKQASQRAQVRAKISNSRRNQLQAAQSHSSSKQGQPSTSQKPSQKASPKAGKQMGPKQRQTPEPVQLCAQEGDFYTTTLPLQVYKIPYSWCSLERQRMRVPPEPKTPHQVSSIPGGGGFYFCALFTAKAGPAQRGARSHGQGGSNTACKAAPRLQAAPERLLAPVHAARRPTRACSEAIAGTRQRQLGPEASCRGPD
ncbi:Hypothetical_protein [Hexamita inflata]|uniref:Hypothetical_protein n=1 Tax=Hexamita inflata TaxID=28002 RepID=A0AA86NPS3_9EUKA|nr:Hypothetical protein HINF_LOCUS10598 [Hexamita inflata]